MPWGRLYFEMCFDDLGEEADSTTAIPFLDRIAVDSVSCWHAVFNCAWVEAWRNRTAALIGLSQRSVFRTTTSLDALCWDRIAWKWQSSTTQFFFELPISDTDKKEYWPSFGNLLCKFSIDTSYCSLSNRPKLDLIVLLCWGNLSLTVLSW